MIERYPNADGCRLDDGCPDSSGPAVDLHGMVSKRNPQAASASLWVRERGSQYDNDAVHASCPLNLEDLLNLRDGINRMLRAAGMRGA